MSSISDNNEMLIEIGQLVRKVGFEFSVDGGAPLPQVVVGSEKYYSDGIFYDPDRGGICLHVVDARGEEPRGISPVRPLNTVSMDELKSIHTLVKDEWNSLYRRLDNIADIEAALKEAGGVIRFDGPEASPKVLIAVNGGRAESVSVTRIDSSEGTYIPATLTCKRNDGSTFVHLFLNVTDRDLGRIASSSQIQYSRAVRERHAEVPRLRPSVNRPGL